MKKFNLIHTSTTYIPKFQFNNGFVPEQIASVPSHFIGQQLMRTFL